VFIFGAGESATCAIDGRVLGGDMSLRSDWREIVIGLLVLSLVFIVADYVVTRNQYANLQVEYAETEQTLTNQTRLIVELRQKLIPKDFDSLDELKSWVDGWEANNKPIAVSILNRTFVIVGNKELYSQYWDCDDIAEAMQRDALRDGYLMSVALVDKDGKIYDTRVSELTSHVGVVVVADDTYYYVEPQTGDVVKIVGRDSDTSAEDKIDRCCKD